MRNLKCDHLKKIVSTKIWIYLMLLNFGTKWAFALFGQIN